MQLAINKKQKYFLLPDHQLAENVILVYDLEERTKKGQSEILTKSVKVIVGVMFM